MRTGTLTHRTGIAPCAALVLVAFLVSPAPSAAQETSYGPLTYEEGSPLYRVGLTPRSEIADPVGAGELHADLYVAYGSLFEQDSTESYELMMDTERLISAATVRYGIAEGLEVGGRLTFETTWAGFMDSVLSDFHKVLHLPNGDRDSFPVDEYHMYLRNGDGDLVLDIPRSAFVLEDVRLFAKWRHFRSTEGGRDVGSLRVVARIPTRANTVGTERVDVAGMLLTRLSRERWHYHGMVGVGTVRGPPELESLLNDVDVFYLVAVEHNVGDSWSWLIQYQGNLPRFHSVDRRDLDGFPGNLVLGFAGLAGGTWRWDVSFQEDLIAPGPAVDFTLAFRVSRAW